MEENKENKQQEEIKEETKTVENKTEEVKDEKKKTENKTEEIKDIKDLKTEIKRTEKKDPFLLHPRRCNAAVCRVCGPSGTVRSV